MNNEKFNSIFDNIDNLEFESMLKECGFDYKKVEPGKGGLYINGIKVKKDLVSSDLYEKIYSKDSESFINNYINNTEFYMDEHTNLAEAA